MHSRTRVAIIGGSGRRGTVVANHFLALRDDIDVVLITRENSDIRSHFPNSKCQCVKDYSSYTAGWIAALDGVDVLLSFLGTQAALTVDPILFQAASEAKVRLFVSSEYTLDVLHPAAVEAAAQHPGLLSARLDSAKELAAIAKRSQGHTRCMTICTGAFLDLDLLNGFLRLDLNNRTAVVVDGGDHKATGCSLAFIARALGWIIDQEESFWPAEKYNRIRITEVEYSANQLAGRFGSLSGKNWTVEHTTFAEIHERANKAGADGQGLMVYINRVLLLNFNGSGACTFLDGFIFDQGKVHRDTLDELLQSVLRQSKAS